MPRSPHVCPLGHAAAHVPLEQQPPLHEAMALHEVEQENVLHAMPVGQSPEVKQEQVPHEPELQQ